jgi:hypothetical protein
VRGYEIQMYFIIACLFLQGDPVTTVKKS